MGLGKTLLWINCALFMIFGLGFVVSPRPLAELITGTLPQAANAVTDLRAMYGGMLLGIGVFFGVCAGRPAWVRPGLLALVLLLASVAGGRIVGMAMDGTPNGFMYLLLAAELAVASLALVALRGAQERRAAGEMGTAR